MDSRTPSDAWSEPREPLGIVKRGSAAYVTSAGGPVVVDARTGVHHRVTLPGYDDRFVEAGEGPNLAISPDGSMLAYGWHRPEPPAPGQRWPSGLRVIELDAGGSVTEYRRPGGEGVRVESIAWSPDGRFLTYRVAVMDELTEDSFRSSQRRLEVLDRRTDAPVVVPRLGQVSGTVSVSNDGTVAVASNDTLFTWNAGRSPQRLDLSSQVPDAGVGAWDPSGRRLALGSATASGRIIVVDPARDDADARQGMQKDVVRVLGWVDGSTVLALRHPMDYRAAKLVLIGVDTSRDDEVGTVDGPVVAQLTVAYDLATIERPTAEFEPPAWTSDGTWWWVGGGALVLLGAAGGWVVVRRRTSADPRVGK